MACMRFRSEMLSAILAIVLCSTAAAQERIDKMTHAEAKARIPERDTPSFWFGNAEAIGSRLERLERGTAEVIATSPGGRPVYLVSYGAREDGEQLANYNSAMGAREATAYRDKAAREKPVLFLVGPVHGQEVEGLTGLMSLIEVMETGKDLRGKEQATLQALGARCRLLIIPSGNPDGMARFAPLSLVGMSVADLEFWGQGTWSDDTLCRWPQAKRLHPMAGERTGFVGCYFNDAGVNPMHDEFFRPMSAEAPAILKVAMEEAPDLATSLHSHGQKPMLLRPAFVTTESQENIRALADQYFARLEERGLAHGGLPRVQAEGGENPASFNLTSAMHHVSGADAFTFECPHGLIEEQYDQVNWDQILDIQLALYESMMRFALDRK